MSAHFLGQESSLCLCFSLPLIQKQKIYVTLTPITEDEDRSGSNCTGRCKQASGGSCFDAMASYQLQTCEMPMSVPVSVSASAHGLSAPHAGLVQLPPPWRREVRSRTL